MLKISSNSQVQNTFESFESLSLFGLFIREQVVAVDDEDAEMMSLDSVVFITNSELSVSQPPMYRHFKSMLYRTCCRALIHRKRSFHQPVCCHGMLMGMGPFGDGGGDGPA